MKSIYTLETDLRDQLKKKGWMSDAIAKELGSSVSDRIKTQFSEELTPSLRLSRMGPQCHKQLWHSIHTPELAEPFPAWTEAKFSIGHFWEAYALMLTKAAGHEVTHEQHECKLDGVKGHIDAIVDGALVDYKSCSSRQFQKYKNNLLEGDDAFGYLEQLDGYVVACSQEGILPITDRGFIVAINKEMGHIHVYEHHIRTDSIRQRVAEYKSVVERDSAPMCTCETTSYGSTGNTILGTRASYSNFKYTCFPKLRCFVSKYGRPVYFVNLWSKPDGFVREIDREGNTI